MFNKNVVKWKWKKKRRNYIEKLLEKKNERGKNFCWIQERVVVQSLGKGGKGRKESMSARKKEKVRSSGKIRKIVGGGGGGQ